MNVQALWQEEKKSVYGSSLSKYDSENECSGSPTRGRKSHFLAALPKIDFENECVSKIRGNKELIIFCSTSLRERTEIPLKIIFLKRSKNLVSMASAQNLLHESVIMSQVLLIFFFRILKIAGNNCQAPDTRKITRLSKSSELIVV